MGIKDELFEDLKSMYLDNLEALTGKTIAKAGTSLDGKLGYLIFDSNEFTILETENHYGDSIFVAKSFKNIQHNLMDAQHYILKIIAECTNFDYEKFNEKASKITQSMLDEERREKMNKLKEIHALLKLDFNKE